MNETKLPHAFLHVNPADFLAVLERADYSASPPAGAIDAAARDLRGMAVALTMPIVPASLRQFYESAALSFALAVDREIVGTSDGEAPEQ